MRFKLFVLVLITSLSSSYAQITVKDTVVKQKLEEVIITATRTYRQLSSLPMPAQLVSQKELKEANITRLNNILNEQTGLITVQNFIGGEGIQMQGLDSEYTLVLVDGVPLIGRVAGTLDLSRVAVGNIKQIEIVKGASSSLYGSDALGGVINIITDKPKKTGFKGDLNYKYGTFNTHDANVNLGYKNDDFSLNAFVNRNSSDGYNLTNAVNVNTLDLYSNYTFNTKLNYNLGNNTKLYASGRYFTQDQDYEPTETEAGEIKVNEWNSHIKVNHKYSEKWSSYFEFYASRYDAKDFLNNINDNTLFSESDYNEFLIRPEIRATYNPNDKTSFVGGIGLDYKTLDRTDFSIKPEFSSPFAYLQYDVNPTEKLNVILGARFDIHNEYESQFSPKVAFRYELSDKLAVKGSVGYGFKAPDFRQLYFDLFGIAGYRVLGYNMVTTRIPEFISDGLINSEDDLVVPLSVFEGELKPENSVSYNFGINYNPISSVRVELNLFRNDIQDLIDTRFIAPIENTLGVYSYYNVNEAYTQGVEINTSWKPTNQLKISGGYQLLFAKDKDVEDKFKNGVEYASIPGSPAFELDKDDYFGLYNRSKHMANIKVFYSFDEINLSTNIRGTYRSKYGLFDTNSNDYLDEYDDFVESYTIWNWAINKTLYKNYELGFGIDNIFDFKDLPEGNGDTAYIGNIPGRIVYTKLNIQF